MKEEKDSTSILKKVEGVAIIIASIVVLLYAFFVLESLILSFISVVLMIVGVMIFNASSDEEFIKKNMGLYRISKTNGYDIDKVLADFVGLETPVGTGFQGKAAVYINKALVFGKSDSSNFIYVYFMKKKCYISGIGMENIASAKEKLSNVADHKVLTAITTAYNFTDKSKVELVYKMMKHYFESGEIKWPENNQTEDEE